MTKAIRIHRYGGPEALIWEDVAIPDPGPGQVAIKHSAIGVNFIDIYQRTGLYPLDLPVTLGQEAAGIVEAVGTGVTDIKVGDRVAYASPPVGAYSERRIMTADRLVPLPDAVDDKIAAAMMLKGMTAHYLLHRSYKVQKGDTILIHAAAGGVGQIACQWAKHLGATVIGTVGSAEKAEIARAHGCDHTILYKTEDFVARVKDITKGQGCAAVFTIPLVKPPSWGRSIAFDRWECWCCSDKVRARFPLRFKSSGRQGVTIHHPPDLVHLYRQTGRSFVHGTGFVSGGDKRHRQDRDRQYLCLERRGPCPSPYGIARNHRRVDPFAMMAVTAITDLYQWSIYGIIWKNVRP